MDRHRLTLEPANARTPLNPTALPPPPGEADAAESVVQARQQQPASASSGAEFLLDKETVRLAAAAVCQSHAEEDPGHRSVSELKAALDAAGVDHRGCREKSELVSRVKGVEGVHRPLRYADCRDLDHHGSLLRRGGGKARHALGTSARVLRQGLGEEAAIDDVEATRLLLRVKYNAHPVLDGGTQSRRVGLGLYPAACYLNHSCFPNASYHTTNLGRTMVFR